MLKFREVNEVRETREEKEKRIIAESKLSKLVKERKGELEMRTENLDKPVVKEIISENEGEVKMEAKDYVGMILGEVEMSDLKDFESKVVNAEKERLYQKVPITEIKNSLEEIESAYNNDELEDLEKELIFEGHKGIILITSVTEEGNTYKDMLSKIAKNAALRRSYNILCERAIDIYYKTMEKMSLMYA